jgi:5'-nucleotidase/UDP-sugar diphosphatase
MAGISRRETFKLGVGALAFSSSLSPLAAQAPSRVMISFVHTNDIYRMGEEKGRGGMARLAAIARAEKAKNPNTFFTHGGDTISPSLLSGFDQGAHMIELFNAAGLDVFVPGNHEFDFGKDAFEKRMGEAKFPVLAANLRRADDSAVPAVRDAMIIERAGIKIGFVGATLPNTPQMSSPGDLKFSSGLDAVSREAKALREKGADFIVALVHFDRPDDFKLYDLRVADLILSGHDHDLRIAYDGRVAMCESGEDAQFVSVIDVAMDLKIDGSKRTLTWWPEFRVIDSGNVAPDPALSARVKVYEDALSAELDVPLAKLTAPLDSRSSTVRTREAAIGNFIADALRDKLGTDVALINGGGIRGNKEYPIGTQISRRDILTELPFGNRSVRTDISGRALKAALENGLSQIEHNAGRFPQVSGMIVTFDRAKPVGNRVVAILINGAPLDEAKTYSVATNDFMLRGGDGYSTLAGATKPTIDSGGPLMASDVMAYARQRGAVDAKVEGRIIAQ